MRPDERRRTVVDPDVPDPAALAAVAAHLRAGGLAIVPTETVYGVAADPQAPGAVKRIYAVKGRDARKPLPLLAASRDQILAFGARLAPPAQRLAERFWPGPLTLVLPVRGGGEEGFRIPAHPVMQALLEQVGHPLRVTSANRSGQPAARTCGEALDAIGPGVAAALDAGPCRFGQASSVVRVGVAGIEVIRAGVLSATALREAAGPIGEPPLVLFVCTGNTCRSAMAEIAFAARLRESGIAARCASAGVAAADGMPASPAACQVLAARGLDGRRHRSRLLTAERIDAAALVVVMTNTHREIVRQRFPAAADKVVLMGDFDSRSKGRDVSDPFGETVDAYGRILDRLEAAFPDLLLAVHEMTR